MSSSAGDAEPRSAEISRCQKATRRSHRRPDTPMRNKPQQEWLCVLELNQAAGPRRNPSLERLWVKRVRTQPGPELKKLVTTNDRWLKKGVVRLREDLMPKDTQPGGRLRPFELPRDALKAQAAEDALSKLRKRGLL